MAISVFDIFKIGIGPSSSHTVGPMRAANYFLRSLQTLGATEQIRRLKIELYGSLGATGRDHGSPQAIIFGLQGEQPETIDVMSMPRRLEQIRASKKLLLNGNHEIEFDENRDLILHQNKSLDFHSNAMSFSAYTDEEKPLITKTYFSVGGGFVLDESASGREAIIKVHEKLPFPFCSAVELLQLCDSHGMSISEIMFENEKVWRNEQAIREELLNIWHVMQRCVKNGCEHEGSLPGGLKVKRRAPDMYRQLSKQNAKSLAEDPLIAYGLGKFICTGSQ